MSGAMTSGGAGVGVRRFGDEFVFRPAFGTRRPATDMGRADPALTILGPRSMDHDVPGMRRRIGASAPMMPRRLPWTIAAVVMGVLSVALWRDAFVLADALLHKAAGLY